MEKCKNTMKRTYCKTHTLARDLGTYIALEPTFAFSLWNNLAFKSMRPFNMGAFNANLSECQHLAECFWTFKARSTAIPTSATSQLPKSLCLWLVYTSLHDFYLFIFLCEEPALTPPLFWTISCCCNLSVIKLKRVYQQPMSFHFCRRAPDTSVQKYFYSFYFMCSHTSLDAAFTDVPMSNQGSIVLMKPATNGGPPWVSVMGHCKSKKRCQVGFLLLFSCSWFCSPLTLVKERKK